MKEKVYLVGCTWEYIQDASEVNEVRFTRAEEIDDIAYVAITDRVKMQVSIIRQGDKYGIYTLDHTNMFGGPGTWCNPTENPFPYDEVKYCAFPFDEQYGLFAFRIGKLWGIIKVVDGCIPEEGVYDIEYGLSKRRIVVPCKCASLSDAELQLGESHDWRDPVPDSNN